MIKAIKKMIDGMGRQYLEAMTRYGEAISSQRGLVGA